MDDGIGFWREAFDRFQNESLALFAKAGWSHNWSLIFPSIFPPIASAQRFIMNDGFALDGSRRYPAPSSEIGLKPISFVKSTIPAACICAALHAVPLLTRQSSVLAKTRWNSRYAAPIRRVAARRCQDVINGVVCPRSSCAGRFWPSEQSRPDIDRAD